MEANVRGKTAVVALLEFSAPYYVMVKVPMSHVRTQPTQTDYRFLEQLVYHELLFEAIWFSL